MDTPTDAPAGNMTAEADAHQALPGAEAVPADMPNSPHGDISLEYTLQNFNSLVAANTAMETAIADGALREAALEARVGELKDALALQQQHAGDMRDLHQERKRELDTARKALGERDEEAVFLRGERDFLQRRLDRALGYLDATLDEQDSVRTPLTHTVPAPAPAIGPNFDDIERPRRRQDGESTLFGTARLAEPYAPGRRHRRY